MVGLDRRTFLISAGAATFLAACGDDGTATPATTTTTTVEPLAVPVLVPTFPDGGTAPSAMVHGVPQRIAYALHDGVDIMRSNAPDSITFELALGSEVIASETLAKRGGGVPTPYYSLHFTPPEAGFYTSRLVTDAGNYEHQFRVLRPGETTIPQPGDVLPAIATGTFDDALGTDPLCTRFEPCPFHDIDLVDALDAGDKPVVLSIATPGFCQTAICGPVVDLLIEAADGRDDLHVVHAEVFVDPFNDTGIATGTANYTDIIGAYALPFEPVLFVTEPDGTIVRRLDAIYDATELAEAIALV